MDSKWPALDYPVWKDTLHTLHRWTQIVGKIQISKTPWVNHSWSSALQLTERGLCTSLIHDERFSFMIHLDLLSHELRISRSDGQTAGFELCSEPVAAFHRKCFGALRELGIEAKIFERPNEMPDDLPFSEDRVHRSYDPEAVSRFRTALLRSHRAMSEFRADFSGKTSPVHFFWGSFDLAVTRFSGRAAPEHPGGVPHLPDLVAREAYSHEVSSCGFWPGNDVLPYAAYYSYAYPKPEGFEKAAILPGEAYFHETLREFILPYDVVRKSSDPDSVLRDFFQSTFQAAEKLGHWDEKALASSPYLLKLQHRGPTFQAA